MCVLNSVEERKMQLQRDKLREELATNKKEQDVIVSEILILSR